MKEVKAKRLCCRVLPFSLPVPIPEDTVRATSAEPWGQWDTDNCSRTCGRVPLSGRARSMLFAWLTEGHGSRTAPLAALGDEMFQAGILRQWQLTLYGSVWSPVDIRDRQR